jgi:hypothetical protein
MPLVSLLVAAGLAFGGYAAWRMERWFWVAVSVIVLALLLAGNLRTPFQAHCLITFGGDAGAFVISTILMATFYGRPESIVCRNQLRWVLVVIGAICFMQTYEMWAGGFERIVQWLDGIDERGPTDLAKLTQLYGWGIGEMQARFLKVAHACFFAMAAMYGAGIVQAVLRKREIESIVTLPSA